MDSSSKFAQRIHTMAGSAEVVRGLFNSLADPELISLSIGAPAKEALPVEIVREIANDVLTRESRGVESLQYGPLLGVKDLREIIVDQLLAPKGVKTDADHIMITTGGLETISLTCQIYINHSDIPGGSTLGNIANRHVSLPTADIGCAQLAMHSPYETAGTKDTWYMLQAMKMFYQTRIQVQGSQVLLQ